MKPAHVFTSTVLFLLALATSSCGGGGGGGLESPVADLTGTWSVTEDGTSTCPGEETYHNEYTVDVSQDNNTLTVTTNVGVFSGTINGDQISWTGTYTEDGGTVTITSMSLTVSSDGNALSGTSSWSWTDGIDSCAGTNEAVNASRIPGTGPVPAAPSQLAASAASSSSTNLSWIDNADNETGYKVERSLSSTSGFFQIQLLSADQTSHVDTGLNPSTTYYYRIRAYNNNGNSTYSNTDSTTTLSASIGSPPAPSGLSATTASSSSINLSWTDNASNETGFRIERSTSASSGFLLIASVGSNTTSYSSTGLSATTTYYYRVQAYNTQGSSAYTNTAYATTQAAYSAPDPADSLTANAVSSSSINLSWNDNSSDETGFKIERSTSPATGFGQIATTGANVNTYTSTGLNASTTYYYRVRAYNSYGDSSYSNVANDTTYASYGAPVLTGPATSTSSITLTWTYNWPGLVSNQAGYQLQESTSSASSGFVEILRTSGQGISDTASPRSYTITRSSGTYYYRVRAVDSFTSDWSNVISVSVTPPTTITTTIYATSDNALQYDTTNSSAAYTVYRTGDIGVGCNWIYGYYQSDWLCVYSALRFSLPSDISGKTVNQATLRLYVSVLPADTNTTYAANASASTWSTYSINFSNQPNYYTSGQSTINPPYTGVLPVEFDITGIVGNWASGAWTNNGILIRDTNIVFPGYTAYRMTVFESLDTYSSSSRRPQLYIEYQ